MTTARAREILASLRALECALTACYPYAACLGASTRKHRPDWWQLYAREAPVSAGLPLPQAADYAFLAFCERTLDQDELDAVLAAGLASAPSAQQVELVNTLDWYQRQR